MGELISLMIYIGLSALIAFTVAPGKGRSAGGWFVISLILSPVMAVILLLVLPSLPIRLYPRAGARVPKAEDEEEPSPVRSPPVWRSCPACNRQVLADKLTCPWCNHSFGPGC